MKNVQFGILIVAILAVAAAIFFKKGHKKPCNCSGATATEVDTAVE